MLNERARRLAGMVALDLWLAARNILRQRRRSAVGLGAVAAGVVGAPARLRILRVELREHAGEHHPRSHRPYPSHAARLSRRQASAEPFAFLIPEMSEDRKRIEAFPQVDTVAPRLVFNGLISVGESTVSFLGEGVDPERERKLSGALMILEGEDLSEADRTGIILGQGLAQNLGVKVGQSVVLLANTSSGGINAVEAHVRGVFATVTKAYDDYAVRVPLKTAQTSSARLRRPHLAGAAAAHRADRRRAREDEAEPRPQRSWSSFRGTRRPWPTSTTRPSRSSPNRCSS